MTEREWLECTDPGPMLEFLRGRVGNRKLRLFACACCQRIWHLILDEASRAAVRVSERYADRGGGRQVLDAAGATITMRTRLGDYPALAGLGTTARSAFLAARESSQDAAAAVAAPCYALNDSAFALWSQALRAERTAQAKLLREIINNPFEPIALDPCGQMNEMLAIAHSVYDDRRFQDLPILADALEEAGCTNADLLSHLRGPEPHVRGCWALDLILGKA